MNTQQSQTCGLAIASLVTGILAFICLGPLAAIPAIIFGHIALSRINTEPDLDGRGMAVSGLVMGYLNIVLVVLVIPVVLLLFAIAMPNFIKARDKAMTRSCQATIRQLDSGVQQYSLDHGSLPDGLYQLTPEYIDELPRDPWSNDYILIIEDDHFTVKSLGRDGVASDDDITVDNP